MITVEVSPTIIEQINEEPVTYWRAGLKFANDNQHRCGIVNVYHSETAAWIARESRLAAGYFVPLLSAPEEIGDRQAVDDLVKSLGFHTVVVLDETLTVVDSWRVE